jgi:Arylsulfatase A and related enzymes
LPVPNEHSNPPDHCEYHPVKITVRLNIIFMLVDDLGYGDLSVFGVQDVCIPNLDRLVVEGVKFTQVYVNGFECMFSRTVIFTGWYSQWSGGLECSLGTGNVGCYDDVIRLRVQNDLGLLLCMVVLVSGLKVAGYVIVLVGKWYLGYEAKFNSFNQGFDRFFGILGGNVDYYWYVEFSDLLVFMEDRAVVIWCGYMMDFFRDEVVVFVR